MSAMMCCIRVILMTLFGALLHSAASSDQADIVSTTSPISATREDAPAARSSTTENIAQLTTPFRLRGSLGTPNNAGDAFEVIALATTNSTSELVNISGNSSESLGAREVQVKSSRRSFFPIGGGFR
jgi:hypothetical protein